MAGLYFPGAAARAEEIDFVPHILPRSSWFVLVRHGTGLWSPALFPSLRGDGGPAPIESEETWTQTWVQRERYRSAIIQEQSGMLGHVWI